MKSYFTKPRFSYVDLLVIFVLQALIDVGLRAVFS